MDILDVLLELDIPCTTEGNEHCRPGWVQVDCPFCERDSRRYHLGIPLYNGVVGNCYRCGPHPITSILVEYSGLSYTKIKELLSNLLPEGPVRPVKKRGKLILPKGIQELLPAHIKYLRNRGFENIPELQSIWDIKGIGIGAELNWCLFIPIKYDGETVSWTTRSLSNTGLRYKHASTEQESMGKKELLYGEDYVRHTIIICEGPIDVWKIGPGAVATMGMAYSKEQILRMIRYPIRAVCFDNEPEAQKRAEELTDTLSIYPGDTFNIRLDSKDPGSATEKELKRIRKLL